MAAIEYLPEKQQKINKIIEKERKIEAPEGSEIEKVELIDGVAVITFREKERKLPKSWDEFCEMFPDTEGEFLVSDDSDIYEYTTLEKRNFEYDKNLLPDLATAEAVLALCQLIQLRNAYNGDWVPKWRGFYQECHKYTIEFNGGEIDANDTESLSSSPLYFKTQELRDDFLRNFRPLIEKLKPLYGIKEGGEE
jgi:hypothetical protein